PYCPRYSVIRHVQKRRRSRRSISCACAGYAPAGTMKIPKLLRRKKLRAATARRSVGASAELEYEEISEPNMKLSRALLIVLLLHVVAVSGIIAFNAIKARQSSFVPSALENAENNPTTTVGSAISSDASNPR